MNKILDLIFEDVKNENETKKTAVTLRISALIFIGYFLCLMAVFCSMGDWMNVGGCLVCGVCYVLSFYTTYWNHTRESAWISQIQQNQCRHKDRGSHIYSIHSPQSFRNVIITIFIFFHCFSLTPLLLSCKPFHNIAYYTLFFQKIPGDNRIRI